MRRVVWGAGLVLFVWVFEKGGGVYFFFWSWGMICGLELLFFGGS